MQPDTDLPPAHWTDDPRVFAWARDAVPRLDTVPLARLAAETRSSLGPEHGRAALALARIWRNHREKFPTWTEFCADTVAAEQASGERAATWRAMRFRGLGRVLDLACGAGGDTVALSRVAGHVVAVDRDDDRLRMARCNVRRYGRFERVDFLRADVADPLPPADGAVLDPDRRSTGGRAVRPREYSPPPEVWDAIRAKISLLAVKVAPGIPYDDIPASAVPELVEDRGECREAVLWFGGFGPAERSAVVLDPAGPHREAPDRIDGATISAAEDEEHAIGPVDSVLYDPGPAVVRAHLVRQLAARVGAHRLDAEIAYLSGPEPVATPFAAAFAVEEVWRFNVRRVREALAERGIGALEIRARRFPVRPDDLRPQLRLSGERQATLVCTRIAGLPVAIFCTRIDQRREGGTL